MSFDGIWAALPLFGLFIRNENRSIRIRLKYSVTRTSFNCPLTNHVNCWPCNYKPMFSVNKYDRTQPKNHTERYRYTVIEICCFQQIHVLSKKPLIFELYFFIPSYIELCTNAYERWQFIQSNEFECHFETDNLRYRNLKQSMNR